MSVVPWRWPWPPPATELLGGLSRPSLSPYSENLLSGSLLATVVGRGAAAARPGRCQAATAAGAAGATPTTPATSVQARPRGSASRAPVAAPAARPPARRAGWRCWVVAPRAPAAAGWTSGGDGGGGGSANQARQQNENAQATSCQWRRRARSLRTWKSAQPSSCLTCL